MWYLYLDESGNLGFDIQQRLMEREYGSQAADMFA